MLQKLWSLDQSKAADFHPSFRGVEDRLSACIEAKYRHLVPTYLNMHMHLSCLGNLSSSQELLHYKALQDKPFRCFFHEGGR